MREKLMKEENANAGDALLNLYLQTFACMNVTEEQLKIIFDKSTIRYPKLLESRKEFENYK